jgi:hypothetical protein
MTTLWRAAPNDDPYFGRGSSWTPSEAFARRFQLWLMETFGWPHSLYRTETDITGALDLATIMLVDPSKMTERAIETFADAGYRWATFHEKSFEGTSIRQYIYLGAKPLITQRA